MMEELKKLLEPEALQRFEIFEAWTRAQEQRDAIKLHFAETPNRPGNDEGTF